MFDDDMCAVITEKMATADALIVGTPVYYGQPNGGILSLMQRLFYSAGHLVQNKPAAALAVCRRGGATATLQTMKIHTNGNAAPKRDEKHVFMNFIR